MDFGVSLVVGVICFFLFILGMGQTALVKDNLKKSDRLSDDILNIVLTGAFVFGSLMGIACFFLMSSWRG